MISYRVCGLDQNERVFTERVQGAVSKIEVSSITSRSNPESSPNAEASGGQAEGMNDELRLLEELGILRFKNTTVSWIVRARI